MRKEDREVETEDRERKKSEGLARTEENEAGDRQGRQVLKTTLDNFLQLWTVPSILPSVPNL